MLSTALGVGLYVKLAASQKDLKKDREAVKDREKTDRLSRIWVAKNGLHMFFLGGALEIPIGSCFVWFKAVFWGEDPLSSSGGNFVFEHLHFVGWIRIRSCMVSGF